VNILSSRLESCPIPPAKEVAVGKGHVEACNDGVIAVVITIMVLELEAPHDSALGSDAKGKLSLVLYAAAIPTVFVKPLVACAVYVMVAPMWLIPDRRFERALVNHPPRPSA
jgi:uncharacterized membrane protein